MLVARKKIVIFPKNKPRNILRSQRGDNFYKNSTEVKNSFLNCYSFSKAHLFLKQLSVQGDVRGHLKLILTFVLTF